MKRPYIIILALLLATNLVAQMPRRNHFAVQIMYDVATEKNRLGSDANFHKFEKQKGTSIGFLYEFDFKKWRSVDVGFETGLNYHYHKAKSDMTTIDGAFQATYNSVHTRHDLAVPLRFVYRQLIARDTYFTIYFGPQFVVTAGNKAAQTRKSIDAQGNQTEITTNYNLLKDTRSYRRAFITAEIEQPAPIYGETKPFNLQLGLGASLQFHEIQIRGGYDWGLTNMFRNTTTATNLKSWSLTDRVDRWYIGLVLFVPEKKSKW